jgi:hypothetical protein
MIYEGRYMNSKLRFCSFECLSNGGSQLSQPSFHSKCNAEVPDLINMDDRAIKILYQLRNSKDVTREFFRFEQERKSIHISCGNLGVCGTQDIFKDLKTLHIDGIVIPKYCILSRDLTIVKIFLVNISILRYKRKKNLELYL